jgi:Ran GTPase-activating protein (RanGAP) involved in mRNA processing and transport
MSALEEGLRDLYRARNSDNECDEVECEQTRFVQQVMNGLAHRVFDLSFHQCGMNVLARVPKLFRLLPNVRTLQLYSNLIRDGGLQNVYRAMQANPQIVILDVGCNNLSDGSVMCLLDIIKNTRIESLQIGRRGESLQENRYSKEALMVICDTIAEVNTIRCFGLSGVPLAKQKKTFKAKNFSRHIGSLVEMGTKLENLDISWSGLTDTDQSVIAQGFLRNRRLKYLNISNNSFTKGLKLVDGICHLAKLRFLDVSGCGLGESACGVISKRFSQTWGIIRLNLSGNPIGTRGVANLLQALCTNDTVVELNLSQTGIESVISDDLRTFLKHTPVLRDLDLSQNNLGDETASIFADVLPGQDTIVNLWMAVCHITDAGAIVLCESLIQNHKMKRLSLRDNFLTEQLGFRISEILQQNDSLRWMDLTSTQVDCFGRDALDTIMKRNRENARQLHLQDLRKQYVRLTIQKSKIPALTDQLNGLLEQSKDLNRHITDLNERISTCETESMIRLDALRKAIDEIKKAIAAEKVQIKMMADGIEKLEAEKQHFVTETTNKIENEKKALAGFEEEASGIEKATAAYQTEAKQTQEALEKDIRLVEGLLGEIQDKMANPKELRTFQIPEYPWPEEIVKFNPMLSMEPWDVEPLPEAPAPSPLSVLKPAKKGRLKKPKLPRARNK